VLDSGKLSDRQRRAISRLLVATDAQYSQGDNSLTTPQILKYIFNRTSKVKDAWSTELPNGAPVPVSHESKLMALYIPTVCAYLKEPSKLGLTYQSRSREGPNTHSVMIELDPGRNRARFIFRDVVNSAPGAPTKLTSITVPGPTQGALCADTAMRYLRVMSWTALEKLHDEGLQKFHHHLRQFRFEKHSTHIKNLTTDASFQVFTSPTETQLVLASRPFWPKGIQQPPPARFAWSFPGNMGNPGHPLHALLLDMAMAVKQPDLETQLEAVISRLVEASRNSSRSKMSTEAPSLEGLFGQSTLTRLNSLLGISIEPVAPGEAINCRPDSNAAKGNNYDTLPLARAIAEVARGISRIKLQPVDTNRWQNFPDAFHTLTLDIYPDQSVLVRAENNFGADLKCFLSTKSRFPKDFLADTAEIVCTTFARQIEGDSLAETRSALLQRLSDLVRMDPEHNFLRYKAPPATDAL